MNKGITSFLHALMQTSHEVCLFILGKIIKYALEKHLGTKTFRLFSLNHRNFHVV